MCVDNYDAESYDDNYYVKSNDSNSHTYDGNKVNIPKEDDDVKYNENYEKNIIVSSQTKSTDECYSERRYYIDPYHQHYSE